MPALHPHLVGRPVSISASGNRLLLHGPTRDLGVLIDLITAIDVPVQMLWVTLTRDPSGVVSDMDSGSNAIRRETRLGTGSSPRWDPAEDGYTVSRRWGTRVEDTNRILVREGDWASIEVRALSDGLGLGAQVQASRRVEIFVPELTRPDPAREGGLRIRPQLTGDRVTLEVDFYGSIEDPWSGEPRMQARQTVLTGRLGDWIPLGGQPDGNADDGAAGLIARTRPGGTSGLLVQVTRAVAP